MKTALFAMPTSNNATLTAHFPEANKTIEFPVTWDGQCIYGEAAEELFFSDRDQDPRFEGCEEEPELDVFLNEDKSIKSRVSFEDVAGELFSTRDLEKLLKNRDKKDKKESMDIPRT